MSVGLLIKGIGITGAGTAVMAAGHAAWMNMKRKCACCGAEVKNKDTFCFKKFCKGEFKCVHIMALALEDAKPGDHFCPECGGRIYALYEYRMELSENYPRIRHYSINYQGNPRHNQNSEHSLTSTPHESREDALTELKMFAAMMEYDMLLNVEYERNVKKIEEPNGYIHNEITWTCSGTAAKK